MASFQAKTGWERLRQRENKNYCSDQFLPNQEQRIPKKQQKNFKNQKTPNGFFSSQNKSTKAEKKRK